MAGIPAGTGPTTGVLLAARIAEQRAVLVGLEPDVRADRPDAVHRMRVACRRLRGALRAYGPQYAGSAGELRWLGAALGRARDSEVLGELLVADARRLPPEFGPEELAALLTRWAEQQAEQARLELLAALDSPRYAALLASLAALPGAAEPSDTLRRLARHERRKARRRLRAAAAAEGSAVDGPSVDGLLHEARKAAKWARYLGETAGPGARKFTARMKALQDLLGAHQDSVVARTALRELALGDAFDGGQAFGLGVLHGRRLAVAEDIRRQLAADPPKV